MMPRFLRTSFRAVLAIALAGSVLQPSAARATDYTDIWWAGPTQDGWGVNLIQSEDFIFATFFVYGPAPAKTPIWYAGNLTRIGNGSFTGGLYQTTGTGIGAVWDPADHPDPTMVGSVTFTPIDTTSGTLAYNVGATIVVKSIVRQTLTPIKLGGEYKGTAVIVFSGCSNSANNGTVLTDFDPQVTQNTSGQLQMDFLYANSENCTLSGAYAQQGLLFRVPTASYVCKSGNTTTVNTTATVYEMKSTAVGLEGRWFAQDSGNGCSEDAKFSAVFP
jgi:hypothetical protein